MTDQEQIEALKKQVNYLLRVIDGGVVADSGMPSCDICGKEVDYHIKHFSSSTDPHIHICDECIDELGYSKLFVDAPPTQKPLSEDVIWDIYNSQGMCVSIIRFARAIEQAHGIVTPHEPA